MRIATEARSGTAVATAVTMAALATVPFLPFGDRVQLILTIGVIYAIAAVGIDLFSGYCGQLTFGNFGFMAIGAYASTILATDYGWSPWVALLGSIGVAAFIGLLLGAAAVRLPHLGTAMGTFFFATTVAVALRGATLAPITRGPTGLPVPRAEIGGAPLTPIGIFWLAWILLAIATLISYRYANSRAGMALRLIKRSEVVAESMGVHVMSHKLWAFVWSTATAGMAGFVYAQALEYIIPEAFPGFESVILLTMAIIGGLGSIAGPIIGAVAFSILGELTRSAGDVRQILFALLLLANLIFIPGGIFSVIAWISAKVRGQDAKAPATAERASHFDAPSGAHVERRTIAREGLPLVLQMQNVTVRFGGVVAIDNVSLQVAQGTIHAIIGPNGAGKTTLLNCISGLQTHEGEIRFGEQRIVGRTARSVRRSGMSRTFQNPSLVADLTVEENVRMGTYGTSPCSPFFDIVPLRSTLRRDREAARLAHAALDAVGFPQDRRKLVARDLSLADQKIVDIARAIVGAPRLLLLDEPTAGLAESEIEVIAGVLQKVNRDNGMTIVVIAHHIGFVRAVADYATVLDFGKPIAEGLPDDVTSRKEVMDVFLGSEDE
ncbi:ABC transporter permease subunit [Ramlibacter sp.]|uniref:branched-chain amino acid ABC transporter ATP-binding protein/permease n=1 Tax=Ramlibacter sp. TaxID=1917967 RepID=UPI003D0D312C